MGLGMVLAGGRVEGQARPDAAAIMARVAANQDRSEAERAHYVYVQHARVISRKGKTVECEETTDSRVVPVGDGSKQVLLKLDGRMLVGKNYVAYTALPARRGDAQVGPDDINIPVGGDHETDRELVESLRTSLTNSKSKDGIGAGLFPLTTKTQAEYAFRLVGTEQRNGREVYHIAFEPKDKGEFGWKGDALIDTAA